MNHDLKIARGASRLVLSFGGMGLKIDITANMPRRGRRLMLLTVFRALKPILPAISQGYADHHGGNLMAMVKDWGRPLSDHQVPELGPGLAMRLVRLQKGWTQSELAARAGVSAKTLKRLEGGRNQVKPHTHRRIVRALNSSAE
jgi:DNA-binding XRE family transcriptional regulator